MKFIPGLVLFAAAATSFGGQRINHEGRILGLAPVVTQPLLFNTAQADAVVAAMQILPVTSAWNEDVSRLPLLSNSAAMIAQITGDLASNRRTLRAFYEMNYVLVPDAQSAQSISFFHARAARARRTACQPRGAIKQSIWRDRHAPRKRLSDGFRGDSMENVFGSRHGELWQRGASREHRRFQSSRNLHAGAQCG